MSDANRAATATASPPAATRGLRSERAWIDVRSAARIAREEGVVLRLHGTQVMPLRKLQKQPKVLGKEQRKPAEAAAPPLLLAKVGEAPPSPALSKRPGSSAARSGSRNSRSGSEQHWCRGLCPRARTSKLHVALWRARSGSSSSSSQRGVQHRWSRRPALSKAVRPAHRRQAHSLVWVRSGLAPSHLKQAECVGRVGRLGDGGGRLRQPLCSICR